MEVALSRPLLSPSVVVAANCASHPSWPEQDPLGDSQSLTPDRHHWVSLKKKSDGWKKSKDKRAGPLQIVATLYSFLFNTSHVVLGDMPDFFQKHVWITRHGIPFTQRPG